MKKLTAEKCREQIEEWEKMMKDWDLSIASFKHLQAYRIALPILEQQEMITDSQSVITDNAELGDGWIKWGGGICPARGSLVQIQFRHAITNDAAPSESYRWSHAGNEYDIIAYRIIPERATN